MKLELRTELERQEFAEKCEVKQKAYAMLEAAGWKISYPHIPKEQRANREPRKPGEVYHSYGFVKARKKINVRIYALPRRQPCQFVLWHCGGLTLTDLDDLRDYLDTTSDSAGGGRGTP